MRSTQLNKQQEHELSRIFKTAADKRLRDRCQAVRLAAQGQTQAMKEKQVEEVVTPSDGDAQLPGDEAELATQLQEKILQVADERLFEVALGVLGFLGEPEELQDVGFTDER